MIAVHKPVAWKKKLRMSNLIKLRENLLTVDVIDSKTYDRLKSQREIMQKYDQDIRLWLGQTTTTTS
jgi:hypothetical protein